MSASGRISTYCLRQWIIQARRSARPASLTHHPPSGSVRAEPACVQQVPVRVEARTILLDLVATYPDDAEINYQTAWVHDTLGREREAVPFYVQAIELGLSGPDLEGAFLGLGSTYRTIGAYQSAEETFRRGMATFPHNRALQVFLAMTMYNLHRYQEAMELLLTALAETTSDETILQYKRAILFYAPQLDQVWDEHSS
jgi:tetratricopeptide (TPR) repeat protein